MDAHDHAAALLRERDPDRYIADLFAPEPARKHLVALHAFDTEIVGIRFQVSEPPPGEIRLQWWRDAISNGQSGGNPLAEALLETIAACALPSQAFEGMLTARIFDLYNDPMPTMAEFEGYAGETASLLFQFAVQALVGSESRAAADAAGHAGVAFALRDALWRFSGDSARRQLFLPRDHIEAGGAELEDVFAGKTTPELERALHDLIANARHHLAEATASLSELANAVLPAFLPLALIDPDLRQLEKHFNRPFEPPRPVPRWRRQLRLWRVARRGPT